MKPSCSFQPLAGSQPNWVRVPSSNRVMAPSSQRFNRFQQAAGTAGVVVGVVVQHHAVVVDAVRVVCRHVNFRLFVRCNAREPRHGLPLAVCSLPVQRPRPFEFPFVADSHRGRGRR